MHRASSMQHRMPWPVRSRMCLCRRGVGPSEARLIRCSFFRLKIRVRLNIFFYLRPSPQPQPQRSSLTAPSAHRSVYDTRPSHVSVQLVIPKEAKDRTLSDAQNSGGRSAFGPERAAPIPACTPPAARFAAPASIPLPSCTRKPIGPRPVAGSAGANLDWPMPGGGTLAVAGRAVPARAAVSGCTASGPAGEGYRLRVGPRCLTASRSRAASTAAAARVPAY